VRLRFTRRALRHLGEVRAYVAVHNPAAANELVARIARAIDALLEHPERGRPGRVETTRELVVGGTPYIVAYRIRGETIDVLAILHGARAWPEADL
jgi:addiction module RelE/StbE family toxin